jgi:hypothetical protein
MRPSVPGWKATALPGSLVLVTFADRDPSRPQIIGHDHPDSPGWFPLSVEFGIGALPIAIQGSPVVAGPFAGTVVAGSARLKASLV